MLGTLINAAAIVLGGLTGLVTRRQPTAAFQNYLKLLLGGLTMFYGFRLVWTSASSSFLQLGKYFIITLVALVLGRLAGRLLRFQKLSNRLGQAARETLARTAAGKPTTWSDGFNTCAALFCAAPLAVLGAVADGLDDHFQPLALKAVMDGLAALGFATLFRWSVVLAALPVLAYQGTLALLCAQFRPWLEQRGMMDAILATDGLLVVFVGLVIFEVRKIELADYLPALAVAPLLAWLWP